jgi:hypothetical protein
VPPLREEFSSRRTGVHRGDRGHWVPGSWHRWAFWSVIGSHGRTVEVQSAITWRAVGAIGFAALAPSSACWLTRY